MGGMALFQINDPHLKSELVDEQLVLIPDEQGWEILRKNPQIGNIEIAGNNVINLLWEQIDFVKRHPQFTIGLYKPSEVYEKWFPLVLLSTDRGWQRVYLEILTCNMCGWEGQTANPLVAELYFGVKRKWEILKETEKYPILSCPKCKNKLPRYPIWVET